MLRRLEHFCSFHAMRKANGKIARFQAFQRFTTTGHALLRSALVEASPRLGALWLPDVAPLACVSHHEGW